MSSSLTVAIIAKECRPGFVKTRLSPLLTPNEAAELAAASLADTIEFVSAIPATRRILFFDGIPPQGAKRLGFEVLPQPSGGLDQRLGFLFDEMTGPSLMIGMDTPQVTIQDLAGPLTGWEKSIDCWFGPAIDGGFWALAMKEPDGSVIRGVEMSQPDTGQQQRSRLVDAGLQVRDLSTLRDFDHVEDIDEIASSIPGSRTEKVWSAMRSHLSARADS
ncbi:hypothetical protein FHX48_001100 [Microbacterium halimionae]|uniref:Glycosyltransferase n=1 Tax=Microbacterium halimionae TaxID=1526413 RepID=A0A7W3PLJ8_9MICO|nr:DUF2064 domain-containing protein [Microbacterium halimionae]MBA8816027.1 hypothetical protein [Microbacterium halimionae]NII96229.1 hypothetical protein [Microbacterium halimionae]